MSYTKAKEREAKDQLVTVNGGGDERDRPQVATVGESVARQRGMERLPQPYRVKGFKSVSQFSQIIKPVNHTDYK